MTTNPYEIGLDRQAANHQPLSPLSFLKRAAEVYPEKLAVVHGDLRRNYAELYARCRRLASAISERGMGLGDTVAVIAPNTPAMLEMHYGVPMTGAVLNTINTRLDAAAIGFILDHGEAKMVFVDREFSGLVKEALTHAKVKPVVIDMDDKEYDGPGTRIGEAEYEDFIAGGDPHFNWQLPADEWQAISLNYTSGTTGNPKGVVYHHRGAHLLAMGNIVTAGMTGASVYLWTVPMFHCNGWCFTWSLSVVAGTHVCLRRVTAANIFNAIAEHGVTHMAGAPTVMGFLINASEDEKKPLPNTVHYFAAAAPPPAATIRKLEAQGFNVIHVYGLTETYGPAVVNAWHDEWDELDTEKRAEVKARQGVPYAVLEGLSVRDPETMEEVPRDGETMGEVMFRGNVVMKGYLKNEKATREAFAGGWFHSGDLGVWHADNYIQLKDRSKDIIISGGENISSLEVEDVLYKHPDIIEAAVVARPDEKWGETPCAFVTLRNGATLSEADVIAYCREKLAHFKCPKTVVFTDLPKTSTGKVQKFKLREQAEGL
ncbi:MAG: acyl-CoA synthetase [Parvibaculum sp.]|jgi:fatty-acyl-CoA synthase|uniref:acyl-CoA synthetase n=1 Tax=Parvibaculum sp. TaxID=2024848 RepID=UPI000C4D5EC8|nr:acyl-CoA synthetase [Parvibaculum sp.]MAU59604.1 acyl-CoA synthetase [Parvibaculum sp.]|tara:strand:+ start:30947 stop:32575 length:1629 start_codon:yes stop_codon:yes gene_type:complete